MRRRDVIQAVAAMVAFGACGAPAFAREGALRPEHPIAALVIGVTYANAPPQFHLANALSDARRMAGFVQDRLRQRVTLLENPDYAQLSAGIDKYVGQLTKNDVALIYYAGHGIQIDQSNYIVPATADSLVPLADLIERVRQQARLVVLIVDACRNNPFEADQQATGRSLKIASIAPGAARAMQAIPVSVAQAGSTRGLAQVRMSGKGVKVIFSTDPGNVAYDGTGGSTNSPFTEALVGGLGQRMSLDEVLADVTRRVSDETGGLQTPWVQGSLDETVFLAGKPQRFDRGDITMPPP